MSEQKNKNKKSTGTNISPCQMMVDTSGASVPHSNATKAAGTGSAQVTTK